MDRPGTGAGQIKSYWTKAICELITVALISFSLPPTSVLAETTPSTCVLRWDIINTPGSFPQRNDILTPCEITSLVASPDGQTLYALDLPNSRPLAPGNSGIWKSTNGGISWTGSPGRWLRQADPPPVAPVTGIAMAPDDPTFIAAICMDTSRAYRREIYLSEDGGTNWTYSGHIPWNYGNAEQAGSLVISPSYSAAGKPVRDIVIGSRNPADGLAQGEIYILRYPGLAGWKSLDFPNGDVITLALSPLYIADGSIVVMSSNTQRTYINLGLYDPGAGTCSWNISSNWPVELAPPDQAGGNSSGESTIITGCLSLPSDFQGTDPAGRLIFAAYDSNDAARGGGHPLDDVFRLDDAIVTGLKVPGHGNSPRISSISYYGSRKTGKLLAGSVAAEASTARSTIWITTEPLKQTPCWVKPLKPPTGGYGSGKANAKLAWIKDGTAAICGTGSGNRDTPARWGNIADAAWASQALDETAFSVSNDDGKSWNQVGLIDTRIDNLYAVAASDDGNTLYLSSVNDTGLDSTWRSTSSISGEIWQRVLCSDCNAPLLKTVPDKKDGSVIFLAAIAEPRIMQSRDSGDTWTDCLPGMLIQDMAVVNSNMLVALQVNGLVRRGSYDAGGWQWSRFLDTELNPAHTIAALNNNIVVGAAKGQGCPASYSTDWGDHWELITQPTPSPGNRHVAFDDDFKNNRIIYMADDAGGLYRWSIGTSNRWDDMSPPHSSYYGIVALPRDTLYAAYSPGSNGVDRTLYSRSGIPKGGASWDSLATGLYNGVLFRHEPSALICSADTIWAIDSRSYNPSAGTGMLWAFKDTLSRHGPWLIAPKGGELINCDPVSGRNAAVDLKWEQLSLADTYEIEIGKDKWFDLRIGVAEPTNNPFFSPRDVLYPSYCIGPGLLPEAGHTYYWHVRVRKAATGQTIRSPWSTALSFHVSPGFPVREHTIATAQPGQAVSTEDSSATSVAAHLTQVNKNATDVLLIILTCVILFGLFVQVILYHRKRNM